MPILIHPAYFPPVFHFANLLQADEILYEISDYYQKQTYRNRMYILGANGRQMLSVPVIHTHSDGKQYFKDVKISYAYDWMKLHWKTLETAYRKSPYFEYYEEDIAAIYRSKPVFLYDFLLSSTDAIFQLLGISIPTDVTQSYQLSYEGIKDLRHLSDAKKFHIDDAVFTAYIQNFHTDKNFIPNLSIFDLLCMEGPASVDYLKKIAT